MDSLPKLSRHQFVGVAVLGLLIGVICGAQTTSPAAYAVGVALSLLILLSVGVLPRRLLVYPLFVLIVNMPDLTQTWDDELLLGPIRAASPWQFDVGPINGSILVLGALGVCFLRLYRRGSWHPYGVLVTYFLVVVTFVSLMYGYPQEDVARSLTDAKVGVMLCLALVTFGSYYARFPDALLTSSQIFVALVLGYVSLDGYHLLSGFSATVSGYRQVSIDSGKGLLTVIIFLFVGNMLNRRQAVLSLTAVIFAVVLLTAYQTRWLLVTLALGFLTITTLHGPRRILRVAIPLMLIAVVAAPFLIRLAPDAFGVMALRFGFLGSLGWSSGLIDVDVVRAGSIFNSTSLLLDKHAWLTGLGYGSWYDDRFFPMGSLGLGAFDPQSLEAGKYYRVHDFVFHMLFKFGVVGLALYLWAFVKPLRRIWKMRTQVLRDRDLATVVTVLVGSAPMVMTFMYWTGKGLLASALFIAVSHAWAARISEAPVGAAPQSSLSSV